MKKLDKNEYRAKLDEINDLVDRQDSVSYTHLDVYKRQVNTESPWNWVRKPEALWTVPCGILFMVI